MNNLYRIKFNHTSDHSECDGILNYVVASDDEQVFEWLKDELMNDVLLDYIENAGTTKEIIIAEQGYLNASDPFDDWTYGFNSYGWELVIRDIEDTMADYLVGSGIAEVWDTARTAVC